MEKISQARNDEVIRTVAEALKIFRRQLPKNRFDEYFQLLEDFFVNKLNLSVFLQRSEQMVPPNLQKEHEKIRDSLCDIGNTKIFEKRKSRLDKQKEGFFDLTSVGDIQARIALRAAEKGLTIENGLAEAVYQAVEKYIIETLLYATRQDISQEGFISTGTRAIGPFHVNNLMDVLDAQCTDDALSPEIREIYDRALVQLEKKYTEKK